MWRTLSESGMREVGGKEQGAVARAAQDDVLGKDADAGHLLIVSTD